MIGLEFGKFKFESINSTLIEIINEVDKKQFDSILLIFIIRIIKNRKLYNDGIKGEFITYMNNVYDKRRTMLAWQGRESGPILSEVGTE